MTRPIPTFACRPGCTDCCGPVVWSRLEWEQTQTWLKAHGRPERPAVDEDCPYIDPGLGCSIYEVRPVLCRLFGTIPELRCPHACGPEEGLTTQEGREYVDLVFREV